MSTKDSIVLRMLEQAGKDPQSHNDWINGWRKLHHELGKIPDSSSGFSEIEHTALASISNVNITGNYAHLNSHVSRMLRTFKHPAFIVDGNGLITAANTMVRLNYEVTVGDKVSDLPVTLKDKESIEYVVKAVMRSKFSKGNAVFKQAQSQDSTHQLTLAITRSNVEGSETSALVFLISSKFGEQVAQLIKNHYGLTEVESQVLINFVEGHSLREIAQYRNRSYATIRTQFNSLMTKMGAHNQVTLLRTALSLSDYNNEIDKSASALAHPFRRYANVMRPDGRIIDVCCSGDPAGKPVLHIPCVGANRFNADIEKLLFRAGLNLITVCPPAYGKTDEQPVGSSRRQCKAEDIAAVLNMLNIDSCPVMVSVSGTHSAFDTAASLPDRISQILLVGSCPPAKYWKRHGTCAAWIDAIFRTDEKFQTVRKLIAGANLKALITLGLMEWYKHQLAGNTKDIEILMKPENLVEVEYGLESSTTFGINSIMEDVPVIFTDYSELISQSGCKISIIHGGADPMFPVECARDFRADHPDRVELFEIEDAGFTVLLSHSEQVVGLLSNLVSGAELKLAKSL